MSPVANDTAGPTRPMYCPRLATTEGGGFVLKRHLECEGSNLNYYELLRYSTYD